MEPSQFLGDAGQQAISYMLALFQKSAVSAIRQKGKAPSSEHPTNLGPPPAKRAKNTSALDYLRDPTYLPPPPEPKKGVQQKGRGRGRGRGNESSENATSVGRGRGKGNIKYSKVNASIASNSSTSTPKKGEHWRKNELDALLKGANHLKPVLKGRFKHSTDGVTLKKLAWEELTGM